MSKYGNSVYRVCSATWVNDRTRNCGCLQKAAFSHHPKSSSPTDQIVSRWSSWKWFHVNFTTTWRKGDNSILCTSLRSSRTLWDSSTSKAVYTLSRSRLWIWARYPTRRLSTCSSLQVTVWMLIMAKTQCLSINNTTIHSLVSQKQNDRNQCFKQISLFKKWVKSGWSHIYTLIHSWWCQIRTHFTVVHSRLAITRNGTQFGCTLTTTDVIY